MLITTLCTSINTVSISIYFTFFGGLALIASSCKESFHLGFCFSVQGFLGGGGSSSSLTENVRYLLGFLLLGILYNGRSFL